MKQPTYLIMSDQTDLDPSWIMRIQDGQLVILDPGGQMDCVALCPGQDDWTDEFLSGFPGVKRTWVTTWSIDGGATPSVIEHLVDKAGARVVDALEYDVMHSIILKRVWVR